MKRFSYKAIDSRGKPFDGFMDAENAEDVGTWLAERQFHVLEIVLSPLAMVASFSKPRVRLNAREMNFFLLQLSSLINAGCPLVLSLKALLRQTNSPGLRFLLGELKDKIEMGKSFSEALKAYPHVFSNLFITMVEVGEVGGILDQVLEKYAQINDSIYRIWSRIIKAMIYPALLFTMTMVVASILLVKVFPVFIEQIEARGGALPMPTTIVLALSNVVIRGWGYFFYLPGLLPMPAAISYPLFAIGFLMTIVYGYRAGRRVKLIHETLDTLYLGFPVLGGIMRQAELTLFSRTLGTLLKCGVPILTSLTAVEKASENAVFKMAIEGIRLGVARGESVSAGLGKRRDLFPETLILMSDVGERGGNIGELLEKSADFYERDLESVIDAGVALIEPLLVIFLSFFVGILALAMYLPLFDIIKVVR